MAILPLVIAPDPRLSICSEPVAEVTDEIRKLMDDMVETMHKEEGVGLSAVQVGVHKRIFVMDLSEDYDRFGEGSKPEPKPYFVVNPEIIECSGDKRDYTEGCLSFPGQRATVNRPKAIKVRYLDYYGKEQIKELSGLAATCFQHELDHLNGVVLVDYVSRLKKDMIMRKLAKVKKLYKM